MSLNATEWDILAPARDELARAPHGGKAVIVERVAARLGVSTQTAYRKLQAAGSASGRKRRVDAGQSTMSVAELRLIAGVLMASRRDTGKTLLTIEDALDILSHSGQLKTTLHPSQVSRLMQQHGMHPRQLAQPEPAVTMRSLHPNHVWQVDSSVCVLYYMPGGRLASMDADAFYRNKPRNVAKVLHELCARYLVTDHYSGAFKVRYFLGGESAETVADFLTWAMWSQDGTPMQGVPSILMADPGPGNRSRLVKNLCDRLQIELSIHAPGAARVNGQVENGHQMVERHFEGRLRFVDERDISMDSLNDMASSWARAHNSTRKHSRHGEPRYSMWMTISSEQLRVAASLQALREAASHEPEWRTVKNNLSIPFEGRWFDLSRVPGVAVGARVQVVQNPFRAPAIDVRSVDVDTGEEHWHIVEPQARDQAGFPLDAPVIGQGHPHQAVYASQDLARGRLSQEAYRQGDHLPSQEEARAARKAHSAAYAGVVDPMADVRATPIPAYLPRAATPIALPERRVHAPTLTPIEAAKRLRELLGEAYTPQVYTHLADHHAEGIAEDRLGEIAAQFKPEPQEAASRPGLRIVGSSGG